MIQIVYNLISAKFFYSVGNTIRTIVDLTNLGAVLLEHAPDFKHRMTHVFLLTLIYLLSIFSFAFFLLKEEVLSIFLSFYVNKVSL